MMQFTREEFAYYYWKVKTVSLNSLSGSATLSIEPPTFSFTATNLPQEINATSANTQTDLICYKSGNIIGIEVTSPEDFGINKGFASGHGKYLAYRDEIGDNYYIVPYFFGGFSTFVGNLTAGFSTRNKIPSPIGSWYRDEYDMAWLYESGPVGTFTMQFSFGTKTCPIYGESYIADDFGPPPMPTFTPVSECNFSASQTDTWIYDP